MKKFAALMTGGFLFISTAFAGGILTNTNQSAQFVRMLSRNASTDLDAVYFNPAGLTQLENGFYFGFHNQSITQNRTFSSGFPLLNDSAYKGKVSVPVFPTAFAVYKKDKWAFSAGFGPNGGGGSAKYDRGLPSFEKQISTIPMSLSASGIPTTAYSSNIQFEGSSVFWGIQLNGSYAINDIVTVSAGVRVILANNVYNGYIKDIKVNPNYPNFGASYTGGMVSAPQFFADGNTFLNLLSTSATASATALAPAVSGGKGDVLLSNGSSIGLTAAQIAGIQQLLGAAGLTPAQIGGTTIAVATETLTGAAPVFAGKAAAMEQKSIATADKNVDTKQTGTGFTPMIGVDIHLDRLNIGLKYEHQTTLILTNSPSANDNYSDKFFPEKFGNDIPAIISGGADYKVTDALKVSASFTSYMDKWVGWGNNVYGQHRSIDKNYLELALGLEYKVTDNFAVSAGYLNSNTGVSKAYQSDFSYSNDSYTGGLGFQWNINERLVLDAGAMLTTYKDETKTFDNTGKYNQDNTDLINNFGPYSETYGKDTFTFAMGVGYKILAFKSKGRGRSRR
jgi:long-subunit fatty acid transport protein